MSTANDGPFVLSVKDRYLLLTLLRSYEGDVTKVRVVRDLQELIGFDDDEQVALAFTTDDGAVRWKDGVVDPKPYDLGLAKLELVVEALRERDRRKAITVELLNLWEIFVEPKPAAGDDQADDGGDPADG